MADDVADRVDLDFQAGTQHPVPYQGGGGAVGGSQISTSQSAWLVAEPGQELGHRLNARTERLLDQGGQSEPGDAADLLERDGPLVLDGMADTGLQLSEDGCALMPLHRQDEREAEPRVVLGVQGMKPGELLRSAGRQPGPLLLPCGFRSELVADRGSPCQLRVGPDQRELLFRGGGVDGSAHHAMQMELRCKGALGHDPLGNPR